MEAAVILAVAASFCTATASVCQRLGARTSEVTGFDPRLILRLVRRPVWLAGIASMILGFGFQLSALRFGPLALVQPTLALELLFVFGYMTAIGSRAGVQRRDWLAAAAMSIGLAAFLCVAAPSGGHPHAPGSLWWLAAVITTVAVLALLGLTLAPVWPRRVTDRGEPRCWAPRPGSAGGSRPRSSRSSAPGWATVWALSSPTGRCTSWSAGAP